MNAKDLETAVGRMRELRGHPHFEYFERLLEGVIWDVMRQVVMLLESGRAAEATFHAGTLRACLWLWDWMREMNPGKENENG